MLEASSKSMPLVLRLAGSWLIWSAWCSASGWGLSSISQLNGLGHLMLLPVLLAALWFWLKAMQATRPVLFRPARIYRRFLRPQPAIFLVVTGLSLLAASLNRHPWSYDAATYRLPRTLYWWTANHWHWIGSLDHRLDFSSTGFEWQMLPLIELTHSDRLLFLLNWLPLLLMPGLVYLVFRALDVNRRSAWRWMWLLPTGFCFALQSSGLQNDGYAVNYLLSAVAFAAYAFHSRRVSGLWLALLAVALLTGAKLSNLPLLLPLGAMLLPVFGRVKWLNWQLLPVVALAVSCSFLPLAFQCWKHTGDWTGDPGDQWGMRPRHATGAMVANAMEFAGDAIHPPVFPVYKQVNALLEPFNHGAFVEWLKRSHLSYEGLHFGQVAYEGGCGLGCGIGLYAVFLLAGFAFIRASRSPDGGRANLPLAWRLAPWLAWISFFVLLAKLGSGHTPRNAATYYPLLFASFLLLPGVAAFERRKITAVAAGLAALAVVPVILLTPARPVIPVERLAQWFPKPALKTMAEKYHVWANMRDDLAPLREQLPPDATRLGFAGAFRDTAYGLWKPFGSRVIVELGLPPGSGTSLPPDLKYAVVTARGISERFNQTLADWLAQTQGTIIYEMPRNLELTSVKPVYESWYLVRFDRQAGAPPPYGTTFAGNLFE